VSRRLDLRDRVVAVTGAAQGIGFEVVRLAIDRGAAVGLLDRDDDAVVAAASALGPKALGLTADVTDLDAVRAALDKLATAFGGIDVLVVNAGLGPVGTTVDAGDRDYARRVLEVNLHGALHTLWAGSPHLNATRGHVVFVSSITAFAPVPLTGVYGVSKAAVEMAARLSRLELAPAGVTVGVAFFGPVATEMVARFEQDELVARIEALVPRRLTSKISPAEAAAVLLDDVSRRSPRTIYPARWRPLYTLRGVTGPILDAYTARSRRFTRLVAEGRRRDLATGPQVIPSAERPT
jgi:NAD(P)-dependent dehydrogenase (short-subunit alcohol dehydrogenase family)